MKKEPDLRGMPVRNGKTLDVVVMDSNSTGLKTSLVKNTKSRAGAFMGIVKLINR